MRSPELAHAPRLRRAPLWPLLAKELGEMASGRALWTMLLLLCPLVGYSFFQAVSLYGEASAAALQSPVLASGLSPLDGILVPTLGSFYVAVTLLFPFVAIRALGHEKETGALALLVQLPYRTATLIVVKLAAVLGAWMCASAVALSAILLWALMGGHLSAPETLNLLLGHLLYGVLVGAVALWATAISESTATAAIVTLAFTIGSWVLDFTVAGQPGLPAWLSLLSLTQTLHVFEQGMWSAGLLLGIAAAIAGFAALAAVWLPPGATLRAKLARSAASLAAASVVLAIASQLGLAVDVSEDRRNSFPLADQRALASLSAPLSITVHLAAEDPRYVDVRRNVLSKLARIVPNLTLRLADGRQNFASSAQDEAYGEIEYVYAGRRDVSRSTSPREILPLLYDLAGLRRPAPIAAAEYPGYPLVADGRAALAWFFLALPLLIGLAWWRTRHPAGRTTLTPGQSTEGGHP